MQKVFASDFDGTLYFHKASDPDRLPAASVNAIRRYQASGYLFGICTGRLLDALTPFIRGLVEPDFLITSSGANIVDRSLAPIFRRGIDPLVADTLIKEYEAKGCRLTFGVEGELCVFTKLEDYPGACRVVTGLSDAPEGLIHQLSVHAESPGEAAAVAASVNERFGDFVEAFRNASDVDVVPKGCSKGKGISRLRKYYRGQYGDVRLYGIGDSINDLPLLREADVSYTFPYSPKEVQDAADFVVPTLVDALAHSALE